MTFVMAGGGTGGHVIPAIAVARELARAGHVAQFVGTDRGAEARLVPAAGFRLEKIRVGGIKNLGVLTRVAEPVAACRGNRRRSLATSERGNRPRFSAWAATSQGHRYWLRWRAECP